MANERKAQGIFDVKEGISPARLCERHQAKVYYDEAKRLLSVQTTRNHDGHNKSVLGVIDTWLEQLLV